MQGIYATNSNADLRNLADAEPHILGPRSRTPTNQQSLSRLDFYGRKTNPIKRGSVGRQLGEGITAGQKSGNQGQYVGTPLMDSIMLEIRTHLEEAKQEITILQR